MFEPSERRKWLGIACGTLLAAILAIYLCTFNLFTPSPTQARAALVEAGLCSPDAPIHEQDGMAIVGDFTYRLGGSGPSIPYRSLSSDTEGYFKRRLFGKWRAITRPPITGPAVE